VEVQLGQSEKSSDFRSPRRKTRADHGAVFELAGAAGGIGGIACSEVAHFVGNRGAEPLCTMELVLEIEARNSLNFGPGKSIMVDPSTQNPEATLAAPAPSKRSESYTASGCSSLQVRHGLEPSCCVACVASRSRWCSGVMESSWWLSWLPRCRCRPPTSMTCSS
jgi:hypothetical protein